MGEQQGTPQPLYRTAVTRTGFLTWCWSAWEVGGTWSVGGCTFTSRLAQRKAFRAIAAQRG